MERLTSPELSAGGARPGRYRWAICAALFLVTTINYMDRFMLSLMAHHLFHTLHFTQVDYGYISAVFGAFYAVGYALCGYFMDAAGIWLGFALTVIIFSGAEMSMTFTTTVAGFMIAQAVLGLAQGANFPGAIKAVGQWFPKKGRALTTGIFNAGTSLGLVAAPLLGAALVALGLSWQWAFMAAGLIGVVWTLWWMLWYKSPETNPRLSADELAYIRSDPPEAPVRVGWATLLAYKQSWSFVLATAMTSPVWWFWLIWIPGFFYKVHHVKILKLILPMLIIYGMADLGSIGGGWLSSYFLTRGWTLSGARKTAMLISALLVVPVFAAAIVSNYLLAAFFIGLAAAGHQGFSANLYTMASDTMPGKVVGSLVGLGGCVASIISAFVSAGVGWFLTETHNQYFLLFAIASSAYLLALLVIQVINPQWQSAAPSIVADSPGAAGTTPA